ncbi:PQQ-dependent sugar dehydrogenase [Haloferacaceae archaeon DSL9]
MAQLWRRRSVLAAGLCGFTAGCLQLGDDGPATTTPDETDPDIGYDLSVEHDLESWDGYDPAWTPPTDPPSPEAVDAEVLLEGLDVPWDLAFAPTGSLFVSERPGRISQYAGADLGSEPEPGRVIDLAVLSQGEGGLLGIEVHPAYPDIPVLYLFYTAANGGTRNVLSVLDLAADDPEPLPLIDGIPGARIHNGGRVAFGPANYLWVTTGDADDAALAQDPTNVAGSVLRLEPDGRPATNENGTAVNADGDADPRVYSYGHRNPQGIGWLPDGTPIITEHGPSARDEISAVEAGDNHGWPEARDGDAYAETDFARPIVNTGPDETWAPSGCAFATAGAAVENWRHRLLVGTLSGQHLNVTTIASGDGPAPSADGGTLYDEPWTNEEYDAVSHRLFDGEWGRIRHVAQGPDGALYAITSNRDGRARSPFPTDRDDVLVRFAPPG